MLTVISYDISNDKTRYRVAQALRAYAHRVQKSVFEAPDLARNDFIRLRQELEELIDLRSDTIRYYFLCGACVSRVEMSGPGEVTTDAEYRVI
jgi:CRISPR-associated protein Cas2